MQDFFLKITNEDGRFKLLTLKDEHVTDRNEQWQELLKPDDVDEVAEGELIIQDFDCFEKFIAIYGKVFNRPTIIAYDLASKQF